MIRLASHKTSCHYHLLPVIGRRTNWFYRTYQINARRSKVRSGCGSCLSHIGGKHVCGTYTCDAADERVGRLTGDAGCCNVASPQTATFPSSPSSVFVQLANDGSLKVIACCSAACPTGATVFVVQAAVILLCRTRLPSVSRKQAIMYL